MQMRRYCFLYKNEDKKQKYCVATTKTGVVVVAEMVMMIKYAGGRFFLYA